MGNNAKPLSARLCFVGMNHNTTPLSLREKLGISRGQMQDALASFRNYVPQGIILATCNRTEVYAVDDDGRAEQAIRKFLADWAGIAEEELAPYLYHSTDLATMGHLCETAAGLRSMIVGEHEILGQVRQALEDAEQARMVNLPLRKLFQHAIRTGRRVRDETDISRNALSVSSVAVDAATRIIGGVQGCRVLVIGAGEAGKLVARALSRRGVSQIAVTSRSLKSAEELASVLGGNAVRMSEIRSEMEVADIVITCSGAPHFVVHRELVEKVMGARKGHPLVLVDIAVPRDVEPEVRQIDGVSLYDIDDFNQVSEINRKGREKEIARAMQIIDQELERFAVWRQALEAKPTVSALMQMAEDIRQRQLSMTLKKLPPLSREERDSLEAMTKAIVNKILHNPIWCLKHDEHQSTDLVRAVQELFRLDR